MTNSSNKPLDIFLIEPDGIIGELFQKALTVEGYKTKYVTSAQQAVEFLDRRKVKLIILELQLRLHNGIELINEIRSYPDTNDIPVIVLSYVPEQDVSALIQTRQYKIVKYLYKPQTSFSRLLKAIKEVLDK